MSQFEGQILEFFDSEKPRMGFCLKEERENCIVYDEKGKQYRINHSHVLYSYARFANKNNFYLIIEELNQAIRAAQVQLDLNLLWEMVNDELHNYTILELAQLYYNNNNPIQCTALLRSIDNDNLHFRRRKEWITPKTAKMVEDFLKNQEKERNERELAETIRVFFKKALESNVVLAVPENLQPIINDLRENILKGKNSQYEKIIQDLRKRNTVLENIYEILEKTNNLPEGKDRFVLQGGIPDSFTVAQTDFAINLQIPEYPEKLDLSHLNTFSIDDESTSEIDDALSVEFVSGMATRVYIHITDVAQWVQKGDILDKEAYKRASTVYLENAKIPMFPPALSFDKASLNAGQKRFAMSFYFEVSPEFEIVNYQINESIIMVKHRLTYDKADEILQQKGQDDLSQALEFLLPFTDYLNNKRRQRGAIALNKPEVNIQIKQNVPILQVIDPATPSHNIVSECMILINALAGQFAMENGIPVIYRTQDAPDDDAYLHTSQVYDPLLTYRIIKHLRPSRFSSAPMPHSCLGVDAYCQMSSPLRRYGDLALQRQLSAFLRKQPLPYDSQEIYQVLGIVEHVEKDLKRLYQQSFTYWFFTYLQQNQVGSVFNAIILEIDNAGYTIEIIDYYYRSFVLSKAKHYEGDTILVRLESVDPLTSRIIWKIES